MIPALPLTALIKSATMLRQQQAEIETLKKELALQRLSDIGQAIEQEPSMRELTDEEIKKVWLNLKCSRSDALELIFAKAILKKASEK